MKIVWKARTWMEVVENSLEEAVERSNSPLQPKAQPKTQRYTRLD